MTVEKLFKISEPLFSLGNKNVAYFMNRNRIMYRKDDQRCSLNSRIVSDFCFHTTFVILSLLNVYFLMRKSTKNASFSITS